MNPSSGQHLPDLEVSVHGEVQPLLGPCYCFGYRHPVWLLLLNAPIAAPGGLVKSGHHLALRQLWLPVSGYASDENSELVSPTWQTRGGLQMNEMKMLMNVNENVNCLECCGPIGLRPADYLLALML